MGVSIYAQSLSLCLFLALGLGLGLLYDLIRPARYGGLPLLWDGIFCAAAAGAVFLLSMGSGRIGIWDIMAILLSFCLYINFLSPFLLPPLLKLQAAIYRSASFFCVKLKTIIAFSKKIFTKATD